MAPLGHVPRRRRAACRPGDGRSAMRLVADSCTVRSEDASARRARRATRGVTRLPGLAPIAAPEGASQARRGRPAGYRGRRGAAAVVKAIHDLVQHHAKISCGSSWATWSCVGKAGGLLHEPSITTVTFYRGAVSQLAPRTALRTQQRKVVSSNAPAGGRLIPRRRTVGTFFSSQSAGITLRFPKEATEDDISLLFDHHHVVPVQSSAQRPVPHALALVHVEPPSSSSRGATCSTTRRPSAS